jgi:hypothetical protein
MQAALLFPLLVCCARADDFFPIMGWNHVPNDPAVIQKIKDSGLTIAGFATSDALDACQTAGLKAVVYEGGTSNYDWTTVDAADAQKRATELIDKVRNHPAVFGYYLRDEPPAGFFPGLKIVSDIVKERHPGAWPYVNLFPNYANAGQLGAATYDEYVEKFVEVCQPPRRRLPEQRVLSESGVDAPGRAKARSAVLANYVVARRTQLPRAVGRRLSLSGVHIAGLWSTWPDVVHLLHARSRQLPQRADRSIRP